MKQFDKKVIASLLHDWEVNNIAPTAEIPVVCYTDFMNVNIEVLDSNDLAMLLKMWVSYDDYGYSTSVVVYNCMNDLFAVRDWQATTYARIFEEVRYYDWYHHTGVAGTIIHGMPMINSIQFLRQLYNNKR